MLPAGAVHLRRDASRAADLERQRADHRPCKFRRAHALFHRFEQRTGQRSAGGIIRQPLRADREGQRRRALAVTRRHGHRIGPGRTRHTGDRAGHRIDRQPRRQAGRRIGHGRRAVGRDLDRRARPQEGVERPARGRRIAGEDRQVHHREAPHRPRAHRRAEIGRQDGVHAPRDPALRLVQRDKPEIKRVHAARHIARRGHLRQRVGRRTREQPLHRTGRIARARLPDQIHQIGVGAHVVDLQLALRRRREADRRHRRERFPRQPLHISHVVAGGTGRHPAHHLAGAHADRVVRLQRRQRDLLRADVQHQHALGVQHQRTDRAVRQRDAVLPPGEAQPSRARRGPRQRRLRAAVERLGAQRVQPFIVKPQLILLRQKFINRPVFRVVFKGLADRLVQHRHRLHGRAQRRGPAAQGQRQLDRARVIRLCRRDARHRERLLSRITVCPRQRRRIDRAAGRRHQGHARLADRPAGAAHRAGVDHTFNHLARLITEAERAGRVGLGLVDRHRLGRHACIGIARRLRDRHREHALRRRGPTSVVDERHREGLGCVLAVRPRQRPGRRRIIHARHGRSVRGRVREALRPGLAL
ncbi:MAG: hypothetical protein BWX70_02216 [Verrucomicrobia bacterium ADurb.Bin070]|nr:MAG: hypothetical protein BWX70_02216 [Verrucomicrobia bacterium ADurb.Bin070]